MPRKGAAPAAEETTEAAKKPAAKKPAASKAAVDINLPPLSEFDDVKFPEYRESYTRKQGDDKPPRKFSAKGPKAEAVLRVLFSDRGFSRQQIADIVGCSASRVTEIVWALEVTIAEDNPGWEIPAMPRASRKKADAEETAAE